MAEVAKGIIDIEINTGSAAAQLKALQQQINSFNIAINKNNTFQSKAAAQYTTELKDLINSSKFFTAETVRMRTAAGALDDTLRKGRTTLGQYFSARLNKNSAMFAETMALASERARTMQTQFIATSGAAKGMQDALAIKPLVAFNSQIAIASQRTQILSSMFRQGTTQLINFGKNVQWAGRQLMVGFTVPLSIFATTAGRTFMDLEKQAVAFKKVYGDIFTTPAELNQNLSAIQNLSREFTKYGIAAKDTMSLAAQAAASGARNANLTDAVTEATRLATLGQMDQNSALETTIALQSAFRLSGEELSNTINFLNMVENQTVVSLQDLAAAIPRVAPVIKGLGGDVRDMSVFLAAMQEGGVSAEQGANALKSGLASLINPTKQAKEMLAGLNINIDAIISKNKGDLMGTVTTFAQALQTLDEFQRQQALEQVFGKFQYARLGALFENIVRDGSQASQVLQTMGYSTEDLRRTAEKELSVVEQSFGVQLIAAVERLKLALAPIGEIFVKMAIPIVNFVTKIAEGFNNLPDFSKKFIALATIITGLVIPAGTMFFGLLMNLTGQLAKIVQTAVMFGKGMISKGGVVGGIQAVSQSMKYMSINEIEASIAAKQLGSATITTNQAFRDQVAAAGAADMAVKNLAGTYQFLINRMAEAARLNQAVLGVPQAAMKGAQKPKKFAKGGEVPGTGNSDTVPAMLMPGEFVVTKKATRAIGTDFLRKLNKGGVAGYAKGTQSNNSALNKTHITGSQTQKVGPAGLRIGSQTLSPGAYYEALSNKVLNLPERLNMSLRPSDVTKQMTGIMPSEVIKDLSSISQRTMFKTMNDQFAVYLSEKQAEMQVAGLSKNDQFKQLQKLYTTYYREQTKIYRGYQTAVKDWAIKNPGRAMFDDDFAGISNNLFSGFNTKLSEFNNKLMTRSSARIKLGNYIKMMEDKGLSPFKPGTDKYLTGAQMQKQLEATGMTFPKLVGTGERISRSTGKVKTTGGKTKQYTSDPYNYTKKFTRDLRSTWLDIKGLKTSRIRGMANGGMGGGPSLLTPGEFVVNATAAAQNRPFLDALNAGKVNKFAEGTEPYLGSAGGNQTAFLDSRRQAAAERLKRVKVAAITSPMGRAGGAAGAAAFPALIAGQALSASSNEMAQKMGAVANFLTPVLFAVQALAPILKGLITRIPLLAGPWGILIAGVISAGVGAVAIAKKFNDIKNSGTKFADAMNGSADQVNRFAEALGTSTIQDSIARTRISAKTGPISEESQTAAQQFLQTDAGIKMLSDLEMVRKTGGDVSKALGNQLNRAILGGVMNAEDAKALATEVGVQLKNAQIGIDTSAKITSIVGPDGKVLVDNILKIQTELTPNINAGDIRSQAEALYESQGNAFTRAIDKIDPIGKEARIKNLEYSLTQKEVTNQVSATADAVAQLKQQYIDGKISLGQYTKETQKLRNEARKSVNQGLKQLGVSLDQVTQKIEKGKGSLGKGKSIFNIDPKDTTIALTDAERQAVAMFKNLQKESKGVFETVFDPKTADYLMQTITDKIAGGDAEKAANIFAQIVQGTLEPAVFGALQAAITDPLQKRALQSLFTSTLKVGVMGSNYVPGGAADDDTPIGTGQKSAFQQIKESYDQTMKYAQAVRSLGKEQNKEAIATIGAANMTEMNNAERKKAIELVKEQIAVQKIISFLLLSEQDQQIQLLDVQAQLKNLQVQNKQDQIDAIEKLNDADQERIDSINRQNELDQRQIEVRNKALDDLSKKEDEINSVYDARFQALDNVSKANDRIAQQQRDTISLASALTTGDIAAAASAANTMAANSITFQTEQTRSALEAQRQREIDALTVSVNGKMMTRAQIEAEIDTINERIYQRNLSIQTIEDTIYNRKLTLVKPLEQELNILNQERENINRNIDTLQAQIALKEQEQMLKVKGTNKLLGEKRTIVQDIKNTYAEIVRLYEKSRLTPPTLPNSGGIITGYMSGGKVSYKGSREPAPGMMLGGRVKRYKYGNLVGGKGNVDRVPALLTPGEFVVNKEATASNLKLLQAINDQVFPSNMLGDIKSSSVDPKSVINNAASTSLYNNNYSVNVNVSGTDASANEIANVVLQKIRTIDSRQIRGNRY